MIEHKSINNAGIITKDMVDQMMKTMDEKIYSLHKTRFEGKRPELGIPYGNPCAEIYMDWETASLRPFETIKTMKPKGGTVGLLRDTTTGIEPYFDYKTLKVRNTMNNPEDTRPHTRQNDLGKRQNIVQVQGTGLRGNLVIEDEIATLTVEMPGVPREELEVTRLDNVLRIRINPKDKSKEFDEFYQRQTIRQLYLNLDEDDLVGNVKLALGILTVEIDLDREVHNLPIVTDE